MSHFSRQGPPLPDPLDELRSEVESLSGEISTLANTIREDHQWIKDALKEILENLEMKSDRDES